MPCCVQLQRESARAAAGIAGCKLNLWSPLNPVLSKPAHSDLLQAIPKGNPQTMEEKIALVRPFVHVSGQVTWQTQGTELILVLPAQVGYDPKFVQDPRVS